MLSLKLNQPQHVIWYRPAGSAGKPMINPPARSSRYLGNILNGQPVGLHQLSKTFVLGRGLVVLSHRPSL